MSLRLFTVTLFSITIIILLMLVHGANRHVKRQERQIANVQKELEIQYQLATSNFAQAIRTINEIGKGERTQPLITFWMRAATMLTTPTVTKPPVTVISDHELFATLVYVMEYRIAPEVPRRAMNCVPISDALISDPALAEKARASCMLSAYYFEHQKNTLIGLRDRISTSTWEWLPLHARISVMHMNKQDRELVETLRTADLLTSFPAADIRRTVSLDLLMAYARIGRTSEALELSERVLDDSDVSSGETEEFVKAFQRKILGK